MADVFEVERILSDRIRRGRTEYKIRWRKYGPKEDSWEPEENLVDCEDVLKAYKAQNAPKAAPTPRRSQRTTKPTPKPTPKPQTKVTRSAKTVKLPSVPNQEQRPKSKKTALENDFITPRPPRATMRQRVLELEESAQKSLQQLRSKKGEDEVDSMNLKKVSKTQKPRNRLQELKDWLEMEKQSGSDEEGASWWIVALCVLCFLVVVALIVWSSPVNTPEASDFRGDTSINSDTP